MNLAFQRQTVLRWIGACLMALAAISSFAQRTPSGGEEKITLSYGQDTNIKVTMRGRGANLELISSDQEQNGHVLTDYQKGKGYVAFDRDTQSFESRSKIRYTLNRLSKNIVKVAPYMWAQIPKDAELDFDLNITNMGYGSLDFNHLNIKTLKFDVNYGDVDISFPSENMSIVRDVVKIHLMAGDLEIYQLGNLKASKVKINGGAGEIHLDVGPRLFQDTSITLDHDIGSLEIHIPKGTHVVVSGTTRDLSEFGMIAEGEKRKRTWRPEQFSPNSPTLDLKLQGPLGDLMIVWD